jgi:predicted AlkP superfamily pyrophosphatase or phosphodiesterase
MKALPNAAAALALSACAYPHTPPALPPVTAPPAAAPAPVPAGEAMTVLISIDGFRPDYLARGITPNLDRIAAAGVSAEMRPSFPSKTYPNHWTLVTGLRPDRHGITANSMEDPSRPGERFTMATDDPFWWNAAEPIWVTAQKAGIPAAAMFWPGANVAWGGVPDSAWPHTVANGMRPLDWQQYTQQMPNRQRVQTVLDWARRPDAIRPRLVTLYFDTVDTAGHLRGPSSPQVNEAVAEVDARIGDLQRGLAELGRPANLVIVSDHGMAATSGERVIRLDQVVKPTDARVVESGPYATLAPLPGREAATAAALLRPHAHMTCWRKGAMPARFHYGTNRHIPPFVCLAETGWETLPGAPTKAINPGDHGFDNDAADMRAVFIASGPAFVAGQRLPVFDNVDVAPLLRTLLGLPAGERLDGSDAPFRAVLTGASR